MINTLILCDTRQQKDKYITDYFDKNNIQWLRTKLLSADYMALRYNNGFVKDYSILIDTKKDLEEMARNLCNTSEHERIKREVFRAKELGCKRFIFLICDDKIKKMNDLLNWQSYKTNVKGVTLAKIMNTMKDRYGITFMFCSKKQAGARIAEIMDHLTSGA